MRYRDWLDNWLAGDHSAAYRAHGPQSGPAVTGCATNYKPEEIQIFTASLRRHHDGPAALIIHDDADVIAHLKALDIDAFIVPRDDAPDIHIVTRRFGYILSLLEMQSGWSDVFACDVRDVMFQASPFATPLAAPLETYQEREIGALADHSASRKWVRRAFGEAAFKRIASGEALCAGTIMGERTALAGLIRTMLQLTLIPRSAVASAFGADQAAFILAVHDKMVDAAIIPNHQRVSTIGAHLDALVIDDQHRLVRPDGFIPPVIHQFDRDADFTAAVERQTGLPFITQLAQKQSPFATWFNRRWQSVKLRLPEWR